jgi:signal transduction histidine kinase
MHVVSALKGEEPKSSEAWTPAAWAATVAGCVLLALAARELNWMEWGAVGIMSALGLATGVFAFPITRKHTVSMSAAVFIGTAALFGAFAAVWVVAVSTVLRETLVSRRGLRVSAVGLSSDVLAVFAAGLTYVIVGGQVPPPLLDFAQAARFLAMFGAYSLTSALTTGSADQGLREAFFRYVRWMKGIGVIVETMTMPLAMLLVASYTPGEPATFPLLVIVLIASSAAGKLLWDTKQSLSERVEELRVLNTLGRELSSALKLDVLMELLHGSVGQLVSAEVTALALYDDGELEFRAVLEGSEERPDSVSWTQPLDASLTARVVKHREPILVGDLRERKAWFSLNESLREEMTRRGLVARAWLGVPLMSGDRFVGVLAALSESPGAFEDRHVALFLNLGSQLARAAENARLYEGLQRSQEAISRWNQELEQKVEERTAELSQAREALEKLNAELEQRVEERTAEIRQMQERAVQSGRMAAAGELAAGLAHELNNPLGGILGYAQYDLEKLEQTVGERLGPEQAEKLKSHLTYIERETQRCKVIVENLLKFAQTNPTMLARTNVNSVLKETLEVTEKQLSMRGIDVELELDQSAPEVLGDPTQLKQVFANIILNARHGMPSGGRLRVETSRREGSDGIEDVLIGFEDNGCGINEENLGRVFEPFFTTGDVGQGMGLGLSVSYGIVAEHGGDIDVTSEVGVGTTFTVRLPGVGQEILEVPQPLSGEST